MIGIIENIEKIKEEQRHCKFCNKQKTTQFKFEGNTICDSCLEFISKTGRNPPLT